MYINIEGRQIYYQKVGKGKDLVLLHGWGQDVSTWWGVVDSLKEDFTVWMIDLPGFGRSEVPKSGFSNRDYAEVVRQWIEALDLKQPDLLGHSFGGRVAIKLAASHPEILGRLILEDSAGIKPGQDFLKPLIYVLAKVAKQLLPNWFNFRDRIRRSFYQSLEADYIDAGAMKDTLTNLLEEDLSGDLDKVKSDVLLIWGENDRAVPLKYGRQMYRQIEKSKLEVIDGVGHFPHLENPDRFTYYVKDFCS